MKENPRPTNREMERMISSGKNNIPAPVNTTSFIVPAIFIPIGPQRVIVNKIFIVITNPKQPETISIALSPYIPSAGSKNTYYSVLISPVAVVTINMRGRPTREKKKFISKALTNLPSLNLEVKTF